MGPLNNEPTAAKMDRHIADATERGARGPHRGWSRPRPSHRPLLRPHRARRGDRGVGGRPGGELRADPAHPRRRRRRRGGRRRQPDPARAPGGGVHRRAWTGPSGMPTGSGRAPWWSTTRPTSGRRSSRSAVRPGPTPAGAAAASRSSPTSRPSCSTWEGADERGPLRRRHPWGHQALRRGGGGRGRHRPADPRRRVLLPARAVGLRQDHDAADDRRARVPHRGQHQDLRRGDGCSGRPTSARSTRCSSRTPCSRT